MIPINFPKISIVTPVFNQVDYIEQTILSVLDQNYPNLEYIIVDGGSNDGTLEILENYKSQITCLISEVDNGMYEALNKGFAKSTGEIMAYINSDDIFLKDAFFNMARIFRDLPEVEWVHGLNSFLDAGGVLNGSQNPLKFSFLKFLNKDYRWIQQESTFWRRSLWERAGGYVNTNLKYAGDFELWFRFFQYSKLYVTTIPIGAWRKRKNQLSSLYMTEYLQEANSEIELFLLNNKDYQDKLSKVKQLKFLIRIFQKSKVFNTLYLTGKLDQLYELEYIKIKFSPTHNKFKVFK